MNAERNKPYEAVKKVMFDRINRGENCSVEEARAIVMDAGAEKILEPISHETL